MGTTTTSGITTSDNDVKLTVLLGGLSLNQGVTLGAGDLTLDVRGAAAVTQTASGLITASGLQLLGSGTVNLDQDGNNVATIAANYNGTISYTDADALTIGTVGTSIGIKTGNLANGGDVTITSGGVLTVDQAIDTTPGSGGLVTVSNAVLNAALIAGAGNITLNGGGQDLI